MTEAKASVPRSNADIDWDAFDSEAYFVHNYRKLRQDDREILTIVRDFFAGAGIDQTLPALDVGSGTNLYPAMAMLPFSSRLDLWEYSAANVAWLRRQLANPYDAWDAYWRVLAELPDYAEIPNYRAALARKARVRRGSVFALEQERPRWGVGTMFFVACSLSEDLAEFERAVDSFLSALIPGAPFAAAFMNKSEGYDVAGKRFPAVQIDAEAVRRKLETVAYDVTVSPIDVGDPLREGFDGMLVGIGRARKCLIGKTGR